MAESKAPRAAGNVEPLRDHNFLVVTDSVVGHFKTMENLRMRRHPIPYRECGSPPEIVQLPGPVQYSEVTLCGGIVAGDFATIWDWLNNNNCNAPDRREVLVQLTGRSENENLTLVLNNAWICDWRLHELDTLGRGVALHSVSLVFQSITRQ